VASREIEGGNGMAKTRFQFTLRTLFIVSFAFAILFSLIKCEIVARKNFDESVDIVEKTINAVESPVNDEIFHLWEDEARKVPGFSGVVIGPGDAVQSSIGYFYSSQEWHVKRQITPRDRKAPRTAYDDKTMYDLTIRCSRPWSLLSRQTSITIYAHPALKNELFLDRWKAEFDKTGLSCEVVEQ
jgi:hypothetical protein